jgi:hypothetical protein
MAIATQLYLQPCLLKHISYLPSLQLAQIMRVRQHDVARRLGLVGKAVSIILLSLRKHSHGAAVTAPKEEEKTDTSALLPAGSIVQYALDGFCDAFAGDSFCFPSVPVLTNLQDHCFVV